MKLARKLIVSNRGLALAQKGEESDDERDPELLLPSTATLSPIQIGALSGLSKGARTRGKKEASPAPAQMV
jgi:hypothetical protein